MEITKKTKIGIITGGISSEREIALRSGNNCFNALKRLGYENIFLFDIKTISDVTGLKNKIDVAFLTTHGKYGEDGAIQGVLEWLEIPYTGSSILASSIAMDKWVTKQIANSIDIYTPQAFIVNKKSTHAINKIWDSLSKRNGVVFLKPKDDGSSVNTFKIKSLKELEEKINLIDLNNSDYLIEEYIEGRELTVSLIETRNNLKILPILELKPKNEFYDFEAKYTLGMTEFILPAKLDKEVLKKIENDSLKLFTTINCSSFGRIDFILDSSSKPYLLEINTLPGMTDTSDLPAQAKADGIEYDNLVEIILQSARLHIF